MKPLSAMILAAGVGSRLEPLTSWKPKALMPLGDRPLLAQLALQLRAAKIDSLVVNAHHHAATLAKYVHDARSLLGEIRVSEEVDLLGTAGGVAKARTLLGAGPTLIWNGDIVADVDIEALARGHEVANAEATLVIQIADKTTGNVGLDEDGNVVRLRQETTAPGEVRGGFFLGVHVLGETLRDALPEVGCLIGDAYLPALRRGARLGAHVHPRPFSDIGTPASYLEANLAWLRARGATEWRGAGASVAPGVALHDVVVGAGATITGSGTLTDCVIWPCAAVHVDSASQTRRVFTPRGALDLNADLLR